MRTTNVMKLARKNEATAPAVFFSPEDVCKFFDKNPHRLIDYISTAIARRVGIPGFHVNQLLDKVGIPLMFCELTIGTAPEYALVNVNKLHSFGNLRAILRAAYGKFPAPSFN